MTHIKRAAAGIIAVAFIVGIVACSIVLACVIFSKFASSPPVVDKDAAAATMVWKYVGELAFNMLVLVGMVKMSDHLVKEMLSL